MPTPTRWPSSTSSWRTRAGNGTRRFRSRPSQPSPYPQGRLAMRALSGGELLAVWDLGPGRGLVERMLALLSAACDESPDALAGLTIGERDARLLTLREWAFGPRVSGI